MVAWGPAADLEVPPRTQAVRPHGDRAWLVARAVDDHVEPLRGERRPEPIRPFDEGHAARLTIVDEAAGERIARVRKSVQVDVEEGQAALVLGHQDEAGRGDRPRNAETGAERLGQVCLARPQVAPEAEDVAGLRRPRKSTAERGRRTRIGADEEALLVGRDGHRRPSVAEGELARRPHVRPVTEDGSDEAFEIAEGDGGSRAIREMHDPGLKVHTPGEPARTDRTHEATFTAGERPCPDPDEIDRWVRDHQVRQVED
jgi:hypothetical protein